MKSSTSIPEMFKTAFINRVDVCMGMLLHVREDQSTCRMLRAITARQIEGDTAVVFLRAVCMRHEGQQSTPGVRISDDTS